ncbi:dynein light chain-like [Telopea speciosissima]|uniref:dynein light chain-like n=1 Tax=Telopea speciosissima TaxID=54955 RepID=UPI001CC6F89B|nr:dynein light chain-like [Telopea speciosissima]
MASESGKLINSRKQGEGVVVYPPRRMSAARTPWPPEVKLAATAVELNVRPRSADMPADMQERAFRYSRALVDAAPDKRPNLTHLALSLKKEFDASYGPAWHCVVGKSFGSFVTHSLGGFLYFSVDDFSFLLFKTEVRPVTTKTPQDTGDGK